MKKIYVTFFAIFAIIQVSYAQWVSGTPNGSYVINSGYVGIGTTNPGSTLDIQTSSGVGVSGATGLSRIITAVNDVGLSVGQSNVARHLDLFAYGMNQVGEDMYLNAISHNIILQSNGSRIGVGVTAPLYKLDVGGDLHFGSTTSGLSFENISFHNHLNAVGSDSNIGIDIATKGAGGFTVNGNKLFVDGAGSGNVGIGTTAPDTKLAVNGAVHATEVKVDLNVPGPDYVFNDDYKLPTLTAIKAYVTKNHHLPEIPSAAQMAKNGINLGEMNTKLLKKVEELTLYAIDQQKKSEQQAARIAALEKALERLTK